MRARSLLLPIAVSVLLTLLAAPGTARQPTRYVLPGERVFPEGIATRARSPFFYVSSTTDGTIFRGRLNRVRARTFLPAGRDGRTTAVGLKVDRQGRRLLVAGGATGRVFVYSVRTRRLLRVFETGRSGFLNDIAIAPSGDAYVTDSLRPVLFRIRRAKLEGRSPRRARLGPFLSFARTPVRYQEGFNLNGIAATPDGRSMLVVQSNTGQLFRIGVRTRRVREVSLRPRPLSTGDGMLLRGRNLYVARPGAFAVARVQLDGRALAGKLVGHLSHPSFDTPTTIASAGRRLLVVNSQFSRRMAMPELPFTVSSVRRP